jgi:hypothetical protein
VREPLAQRCCTSKRNHPVHRSPQHLTCCSRLKAPRVCPARAAWCHDGQPRGAPVPSGFPAAPLKRGSPPARVKADKCGVHTAAREDLRGLPDAAELRAGGGPFLGGRRVFPDCVYCRGAQAAKARQRPVIQGPQPSLPADRAPVAGLHGMARGGVPSGLRCAPHAACHLLSRWRRLRTPTCIPDGGASPTRRRARARFCIKDHQREEEREPVLPRDREFCSACYQRGLRLLAYARSSGRSACNHSFVACSGQAGAGVGERSSRSWRTLERPALTARKQGRELGMARFSSHS